MFHSNADSHILVIVSGNIRFPVRLFHLNADQPIVFIHVHNVKVLLSHENALEKAFSFMDITLFGIIRFHLILSYHLDSSHSNAAYHISSTGFQLISSGISKCSKQ